MSMAGYRLGSSEKNLTVALPSNEHLLLLSMLDLFGPHNDVNRDRPVLTDKRPFSALEAVILISPDTYDS